MHKRVQSFKSCLKREILSEAIAYVCVYLKYVKY